MFGKSADVSICIMLSVVALVASAGFYSFPLIEVTIGDDSAMSAYIGEAVAAGGVPYVDVVDHEGPLVYAINALGALGPSTWVLWALEWVFLAASLCLAYGVGCVVGAPRLAAVAVPVLLVPHIVLCVEGGNTTEEYSLPFMLSSVLLIVRALRGMPFTGRHAAGLGVLAAGVFMSGFTALIGLLPLYAAVLAVTCAKRGVGCALSRVGWFLLGFALAAGPFIAWLAAIGALEAFDAQYLAFNVAYAGAVDDGARWGSLAYFAQDAVLALSAAAAVTAFALCWLRRHAKCGREMTIVATAFVGMAALFALAALSGRSYGRHLLPLVPMYVVIFDLAVLQVRRVVANRMAVAAAGFVAALALVYFPAALGAYDQVAHRSSLAEPYAAVVAEVPEIANGPFPRVFFR